MHTEMLPAAAARAGAASASNPWLKPSEYAARHGISRQTVWDWIRKGVLEVTGKRSERPQRRPRRMGVRVREKE